MKKSPFKKKLKIAFWLFFVSACLWLIFIPHKQLTPPPSITVKVEHPPIQEQAPPETKVENPTPPEASGEEAVSPSPQTAVIPVTPEKEEPVVSGRKAKIAIIIDDVGPDLKGSERAIKLPAAATLSFLPYAVRLREQAKEALEGGHELLLHMPMQPLGHEDPGPGALLVGLPMPELQQRFEAALASFTGFDGVNNHMGSKFTTYADGMNMVIDELQQRHLFFLDSRTNAQSIGKKIADEKKLPAISRDVFLDDDPSPEAIRKQLQATEHIAQHKGYAVAIGHPHATTMDVLETWMSEAPKEGYELVPLHNLVKEQP